MKELSLKQREQYNGYLNDMKNQKNINDKKSWFNKFFYFLKKN